jgi:CheY-like chemotaxis protein
MPKRILCVDDEEIGLVIRKCTLETQGYAVVTARDGDSALDLVASEPFDLVVLDYAMPDMNGAQVARFIRALNPQMPILLLSAYVSLPTSEMDCANAYLSKAESPDVFLAAVSRMTHSAEQARA